MSHRISHTGTSPHIQATFTQPHHHPSLAAAAWTCQRRGYIDRSSVARLATAMNAPLGGLAGPPWGASLSSKQSCTVYRTPRIRLPWDSSVPLHRPEPSPNPWRPRWRSPLFSTCGLGVLRASIYQSRVAHAIEQRQIRDGIGVECPLDAARRGQAAGPRRTTRAARGRGRRTRT